MDKTSFRARAQKVFGSLSPSLSSYSIDIPLWFLPDDGVEKREFWSPCKDTVDDHDERLFSLSLDDYFDKNWKVQETNSKNAQDVWNEIETLIGSDSMLDNEEEDGYDRVAEGRAFSGSCSALPTSFQDAHSDLGTDHPAAQIRLKEDAEEAYKDEKSLFDVIIEASEDNFQFKSTLEGKEDADTAVVISTKFDGRKCKTASNEDQSLKSILERKANANNHAEVSKSVTQVGFDDLACEEDFHGPSKERKDIGNETVKSRKHVTFDLACKDDGELALKKHQGLKSFAERKIRRKKMQRLPKLNPESLSALAQLARLIAEVRQRKEGSSSILVEETKSFGK